jgi:hypothetical protein
VRIGITHVVACAFEVFLKEREDIFQNSFQLTVYLTHVHSQHDQFARCCHNQNVMHVRMQMDLCKKINAGKNDTKSGNLKTTNFIWPRHQVNIVDNVR